MRVVKEAPGGSKSGVTRAVRSPADRPIPIPFAHGRRFDDTPLRRHTTSIPLRSHDDPPAAQEFTMPSLSPFLHAFARPAAAPTDFINIVRGQGALVFDSNDKPYVDALASLWYCQVGHGRTEIADAVAAQMRSIAAFHTFDRFTNPAAETLAGELADLAPMPNARVFLTSGGSESVDTAMKIARIAHAQAGHPERRVIISRMQSYHGVNYGGLSATGLPLNKAGFGELLPEVVHVPQHDLDAVGAMCATHAGRVAAIISEPVQGAGGVHPPAPGYLEGLRALADQHGAYLIFDEVICGFGRLGQWWAAQHYGVTPDLVTFAKGVSSGYQPLGGVLVGKSVREALEADSTFMLRHGYTYSGHPSACAAGLANLAILKNEGLIDRAPHIGARLSAGLQDLQRRGLVTQVRGEGAVWAVSVPEGIDVVGVRNNMMEAGVIVRPIPPSTLAMCPPLVITDDQIDQIIAAFDAALSQSV
jgi:putrescine---pyruvate transaminase